MVNSNIIQRTLTAIKESKTPPGIFMILGKAAPELPLPAFEGLLEKLVSDKLILEHTPAIRSVRIASMFRGSNKKKSTSKVTYRITADGLNYLYSAN